MNLATSREKNVGVIIGEMPHSHNQLVVVCPMAMAADTATDLAEVAKSDALRKDAEKGDANAQYLLGTNYEDGRGVAKDLAQAVVWFRKSAEQGHRSFASLTGSAHGY